MNQHPNLFSRNWLLMIVCLSLVLSGCLPLSNSTKDVEPELKIIPVSGGDEKTAAPTAAPELLSSHTIVPVSPTADITRAASTEVIIPEPPSEVSILFTGVIVPARCIHESLETRQDFSYPYQEILDLLKKPDLTVGILNASLSASTPKTYCEQTLHLIGDPANAPALKDAGFDVINMGTNHIKNCRQVGCGDLAFYETLQAVQSAGLLSLGAGKTLEDAYKPLYVNLEGTVFAFVSMNQIEPTSFAGEFSPGSAEMTKESIRQWVGLADDTADVVIFLPHWGPEDSPIPTWIQRDLAQAAVDAGADLIVGNHTHVIQGYEEINGIMVFYGLGNFLFDQTQSTAHQQSVLLELKFLGEELTDFELHPLRSDGNGRIYQPGASEAEQILEDMQTASPN